MNNNVALYDCAITASDRSQVDFYEPPATHFGMGSIAPQFHDQPIKIPTRTLDSLLEEQGVTQVNLIKVDVEGYEFLVFKGAQKLLNSNHPPMILFEFCDWAEERAPGLSIGDSQRILMEYGYSIYYLSDYLKDRKVSPIDGIITQGFNTLLAIKNAVCL